MPDDLRLRTRMVSAGLWLSTALLVAVSGWIAATWSRPHRGGLAAMVAAAAVATVIIALLPHGRIVAGRFREPFFLSWSLSLIAFISVAADLDAGVRSPIVLMLFLTLVYAALSYPRWAVAVVSAFSLLAVLILGLIGARHHGVPADPVYLTGLIVTLAMTGVMCILQARIHEEIRADLGRLSRSDPLTGCLNRLGFTECFDRELRGRCSRGESVALLVFDLDHFKVVNDRLGHSAGDELLCWAVSAMASALRPGDSLGRLGGDEFAALLPGTEAVQARHICDRLVLALSPRVSASAGVATSRADGPSADVLDRLADERLYDVKRGRPIAPPAASLPL